MNSFRTVALLGVLLAAASLAACDPCAGLAACKTPPELNYYGRVIDRETGRPAAGARVSFIRVAGGVITPDTLAGVSDDDGFFALRGTMADDGIVFGDYIIEPPAHTGYPPYTVRFQPLGSRPRAGDGGDLGTLVLQPYFVYIAEVRNAADQRVRGARLEFTRTGGVGATPADTTVTTDSDGMFYIVFRAEDYGVIEGQFTMYPSAGGIPLVTPVRINTSHTMHLPYGTRLSFVPSGN